MLGWSHQLKRFAFRAVIVCTLELSLVNACQANEVLYRPFTLYRGMGSCSEWVSARAHSPDKAATLEAYALGYATAYDEYQDQQHGLEFKFDKEYLFDRIDTGCTEHPQGDILGQVDNILHDEWEKAWRHDH